MLILPAANGATFPSVSLENCHIDGIDGIGTRRLVYRRQTLSTHDVAPVYAFSARDVWYHAGPCFNIP